MKNILLLLTVMLFTCTSAFAVPVMIQNLSTGNSVISGGYDAHIYLGVRNPDLNCINDQAFYFVLSPNQLVTYDGQSAMAGTCLQDFFWGISCSDPTFDQYFPGMRFWIQQGTFSGAQPIPEDHSISGITNELSCHMEHHYLQWLAPNQWTIMNQNIVGTPPDYSTDKTQLRFIDLGFMHQYIFF